MALDCWATKCKRSSMVGGVGADCCCGCECCDMATVGYGGSSSGDGDSEPSYEEQSSSSKEIFNYLLCTRDETILSLRRESLS